MTLTIIFSSLPELHKFLIRLNQAREMQVVAHTITTLEWSRYELVVRMEEFAHA